MENGVSWISTLISSRSESDREEIPSGNSGPGFIHTPLLKGKGPYNVVHRGARQGLVFLSRLGLRALGFKARV